MTIISQPSYTNKQHMYGEATRYYNESFFTILKYHFLFNQ